jgi:hypothetical protein
MKNQEEFLSIPLLAVPDLNYYKKYSCCRNLKEWKVREEESDHALL